MNIKNLFITSLISSVSFFLNILPVRGEGVETASQYLEVMPPGGMSPFYPLSPGEFLLKLFTRFILFPLVLVVIILLIIKSVKKQKEEKRASKPKKSVKKPRKVKSK